MDKRIASVAAEDDETRCQIFNQIWDRIEEIVSVCGASSIMDAEGHGFALDGEEEKRVQYR